jgi:superfamily I DNA/RNA helicase
LDVSYRTTRQILTYATEFYRRRLPADEEAEVLPDMRHMPAGIPPVLLQLTAQQDEATRVVNEIRALQQRGIPLADILIIHTSWEEIQPLLTRLRTVFGRKVVDPRHDKAKDVLRVCPLNAATGLESPIVFLMGSHLLFEMEESLRLTETERAELVRDNTRRLYMAMTRAGQRLVMTVGGQTPTTLIHILGTISEKDGLQSVEDVVLPDNGTINTPIYP